MSTAAATLTTAALCVWMPRGAKGPAGWEKGTESVYEIWPVAGNPDGLPMEVRGMCMLGRMSESDDRWFFVIPRPCVSVTRSVQVTETGFESAPPGAEDNISVTLLGTRRADGSYLVKVTDDETSFSFEMRKPQKHQ